jgi:hypothetical protein
MLRQLYTYRRFLKSRSDSDIVEQSFGANGWWMVFSTGFCVCVRVSFSPCFFFLPDPKEKYDWNRRF